MAADSAMLTLYHLQCLKDRANSIYHHHPCPMCRPFPGVEAGNPAHFQHTLHEAEVHRTSRTALLTILNQFAFATNIT